MADETEEAGKIERLSDTGQVYVSLAAARIYAGHKGLAEEEARRQLTTVAMRAVEAEPGDTGVEKWRARDRLRGDDIQLHVAREQGLVIVVHIHVRGQAKRSEQRKRAAGL